MAAAIIGFTRFEMSPRGSPAASGASIRSAAWAASSAKGLAAAKTAAEQAR